MKRKPNHLQQAMLNKRKILMPWCKSKKLKNQRKDSLMCLYDLKLLLMLKRKLCDQLCYNSGLCALPQQLELENPATKY